MNRNQRNDRGIYEAITSGQARKRQYTLPFTAQKNERPESDFEPQSHRSRHGLEGTSQRPPQTRKPRRLWCGGSLALAGFSTSDLPRISQRLPTENETTARREGKGRGKKGGPTAERVWKGRGVAQRGRGGRRSPHNHQSGLGEQSDLDPKSQQRSDCENVVPTAAHRFLPGPGVHGFTVRMDIVEVPRATGNPI